MTDLPELRSEEWRATRDYLQQVALVLGALQRGFMPKHPRLWQYGLEVNMRGLKTQEFTLKDGPMRATLDLVGHKVRLAGEKWRLRENPPAQILANIKEWLARQGVEADLDEPEFPEGIVEFDTEQADTYASALWWMEKQFQEVQAQLTGGVTQPILLFPHHFDLSLVWFPWDDERQIGFGWSTGDETIPEAYVYLTTSPEPEGFTKLELPAEAYWQKEGFSGAILPYEALVKSPNPETLFKDFSKLVLDSKKLFIP